MIGWNREMEVLTGVDREEVLGDDDTAKFFQDSRTRTLANAVADDPDRADETFGADRSGRDQRAYELEQELENAAGETLYVHSVATPIYQAGELQGVIQLIQDNTEVIRRREAMASLVEEAADGIGEVATVNDEQAASVEELTAVMEHIDGRADDIEARTEEIRGLTGGQRDDLDNTADYLDELAGVDVADRVD